MPGLSAMPAAVSRRSLSLACLACLAIAPAASAGPIADTYNRWSNQRKTQVQAEKPFSGQSGQVSAGQSSILHNLRSRLTTKPSAATSTHTMKTETFHHAGGSLIR